MKRTADTNKYDEEPVFYCTKCLSLRIRSALGMDYCDECGSSDIASCNIEEWERMFRERYKRSYINK